MCKGTKGQKASRDSQKPSPITPYTPLPSTKKVLSVIRGLVSNQRADQPKKSLKECPPKALCPCSCLSKERGLWLKRLFLLIPFAIKNLLNGEGGFGGGQPCGLAAAPQNTSDPHAETLCIELVLVAIYPMERHIYESQGGFGFRFGGVGGQEVGGKVRGAGRSGRGYLFHLVGLEEAEELLVGPGVAS